jgi:hypothetical protein
VKRFLAVVNVVSWAFTIAGVYILISWMDYRYPVKIQRRVIQTIGVTPGEEFRYINYFMRSKYCDTVVKLWFVGSDGVVSEIDPLASFMPTEALNIPQQSLVKIVVPRYIPHGPAKSCFQPQWICNPIQRFRPIVGPETCIDFLVRSPK